MSVSKPGKMRKEHIIGVRQLIECVIDILYLKYYE
jgi:hypothetical protein